MNYCLVVIALTCMTFNEIIASSMRKRQELLYVISASQGKDKNEGVHFNAEMRNFPIGTVFKLTALWQMYSSTRSGAETGGWSLWPRARVPYIIDRSFTSAEYQIIMEAIYEFHAYTCIRFVPYNGEETYIYITPNGNECYSTIGYTGKVYNVYLPSSYCVNNKGTVMHELMHSIGFIHEHNRHDRDKYISVQWSNIQPGAAHNFRKLGKKYMNDFGLPYDFGSLMHYPDDAFGEYGQRTIIPKVYHNIKMGQRNGFSPIDIARINRMYKCPRT